eukprot:TRINITY_DN11434_c0_g1_i5.p1 TRINITY_DN11434_c0_g1~~TRINITY_DN11434_c0_g1_i5.p1  ORF type:complete len:423 (+),score=12.47 TRINITY_DN11434_c0_g1_i5:83-1270(+)
MDCELPRYKLDNTPSRAAGVSFELERDVRSIGCEMIQSCGILLGCSQVVMACAQILFQRFYCKMNLLKFDFETAGLACLFLAAKVEEDPRGLRSIINVGGRVKHKMTKAFHQDSSKLERPVMPGSDSYFTIKNDIIKAERRVLKELGFCVHLNHPHKLIVSFLHLMKLVGNKDLLQAAWACMNDSLRTDVFLRFQSSIIACACLHLAAAKTGIGLPDKWYTAFGCSEEAVSTICTTIQALYERPKLYWEDVEARLDALRPKPPVMVAKKPASPAVSLKFAKSPSIEKPRSPSRRADTRSSDASRRHRSRSRSPRRRSRSPRRSRHSQRTRSRSPRRSSRRSRSPPRRSRSPPRRRSRSPRRRRSPDRQRDRERYSRDRHRSRDDYDRRDRYDRRR